MPNLTDTQRFLQAVFGPDWAELGFLVNSSNWIARTPLEKLDPTTDCYWSIGTFAPGATNRLITLAGEVRAFVADDVGTLVDELVIGGSLGTPTAIIRSSPGNYQWAYRLSAPVPVNDWHAFAEGVRVLAGVPKFDQGYTDAVHLFRLPMGVNNQKDRGGCPVELIELNAGVVLDVGRVTPAARSVGPSSGTSSGGGADVKLGLDDLREFMSWIPNDENDHRGVWADVGHGLKALCENDADGLVVFDEWSSTWTGVGSSGKGYDEAHTREKWRSFGARGLLSKGGRLKARAQALNPEGFARMFAARVFDDGDDEARAAALKALGATLAGTVNFRATDQQKSARAVLGVLGGTVRQVGKDDWRQFDPATGRWLAQPGNHMLRLVEEALQKRRSAGALKAAATVTKKSYLSAVASLAAVHASVVARETDFDADPLLLGTPSGVIELKAGGSRVVRAGRPEDMVSRATKVDPAPAGAVGASWKKFLGEFTQGDLALEDWLQIFAGYCLTGLRVDHVMPFIYGSGTNGKSVFVNALRGVWGQYGKPVDHRLLFEKAGGYHLAPLAALSGVRLATVTDVPQGAMWDMHVVKMLVSDDPIEANRMHQDPIVFELMAKIVVSGNHQPMVKDMDEGVRRRLRLLPMTKEVDAGAIDLGLGARLRGEWPEILRWALDGLDMYWARGKLGTCSAITDATDEYTSMLDPFGRWLKTLVPVDGGKLSPADLYGSWDAFRGEEGCYGAMPNSPAMLMRKLREKHFRVTETSGKPFLRGYGVPNPASKVF